MVRGPSFPRISPGPCADREEGGDRLPSGRPKTHTPTAIEGARGRRTKDLLLARLDLPTGRRSPVAALEASPAGGRLGADASPDGAVACLTLEASDHPPEVRRLDAGAHVARRLFAPNPVLDAGARGKRRLIAWRSLDGDYRQGALPLPPAPRADGPGPVIVDVSGGSLGPDLLHRFDVLTVLSERVLAGHGYAVLHPDLPSRGRDPPRQLPGLLLPALDRLIEEGIADPRRIGRMGHSDGGSTVLALLTQTDRFAAAVASAPVGVNLTSFYGILDEAGDSPWPGWAETGQGAMGGTPWEKRGA